MAACSPADSEAVSPDRRKKNAASRRFGAETLSPLPASTWQEGLLSLSSPSVLSLSPFFPSFVPQLGEDGIIVLWVVGVFSPA